MILFIVRYQWLRFWEFDYFHDLLAIQVNSARDEAWSMTFSGCDQRLCTFSSYPACKVDRHRRANRGRACIVFEIVFSTHRMQITDSAVIEALPSKYVTSVAAIDCGGSEKDVTVLQPTTWIWIREDLSLPIVRRAKPQRSDTSSRCDWRDRNPCADNPECALFTIFQIRSRKRTRRWRNPVTGSTIKCAGTDSSERRYSESSPDNSFNTFMQKRDQKVHTNIRMLSNIPPWHRVPASRVFFKSSLQFCSHRVGSTMQISIFLGLRRSDNQALQAKWWPGRTEIQNSHTVGAHLGAWAASNNRVFKIQWKKISQITAPITRVGK